MALFTLLTIIGIVVAASLVTSAILQWLWNMTMPEALGTKPIRYWVAFRILLISMLMSSGGMVNFKLGG